MGFTSAHSMIDVKLISETTIKPSNPTPTHLRFLKTSLFERVTYPIFMPLVFFYAPPTHTTTTTTTTTNNNTTTKLFLDRLRNSLPKTLSLFYPLAGRVQDDVLNYITCNDEGVPYIETQVSGVCFNNFVNKAEATELDKLLPYHGSHGLFTKLLLAIQVNAFPCGGVAITIKTSHALSDGFSQLMFVKTWADIANSNDVYDKPCFEIHKLFPPPNSLVPKAIDYAAIIPSPDFVGNKPVTKWFRFTKAKLDRLRSNIMSISSNHSINYPSLFLVLSGFILSRLKLACKDYDIENARNVPYEIISPVSIRPKLSHPIELSYYYGNVFINAIAKPSMKASGTESLCLEFIDEMSKSIGNILSDDMRLIKDAQQGKEDLNSVIESFERGLRGEVMCIRFSNLRNLPVYEADFGWGKPVWVTAATFSCVGTNIIFPAATGHDVIAFLSLTAQDMVKLTRDPEFLSMLSTNQAFSKL